MRIRRARVTPETALRARQRMAALTPSAAPDEGPAQPVEDEEGAVAALEELRAALADHVPATVRSGRLALSRGAAMGLAALCAAAVALALGALWRSHATPAPLTALSSAPSATSAPAAAPRASSSPAVVVVDVAGKVRRPGVVRLPAGSRVVDALRAAGGALRGVDLTDLNLARALQDGEQVVVGSTVGTASAPPAPGAAAAASPARVNLNAATLADLETLPGIGPALGQRILDWRSAHGRFSSVQELREVSGIGDARFAVLAPRVSV